MRPIGQRIRQACEIVEQIGPCTYAQVHALMEGVIRENASKYCRRAVSHGLMTVDKTIFPARYAVADDWRERLDGVKTDPPVSRPVISSVFDLGRLYAP